MKREEEYIERIYKIKDLLPRVINSDGAYWCKFDKDWHANAYLQLGKPFKRFSYYYYTIRY
ncbi:MAG: UPF0236 family protein [Clostridiales Family XIII bacterium]|nr:UPF0236 family protein [Clostridiales Family XIII bacterium]